MDPFVAEIRIFPFFAPKLLGLVQQANIAYCPQNTALFSLLGTTYGEMAKATSRCPTLQGFGISDASDKVGACPGHFLSDQRRVVATRSRCSNQIPSHSTPPIALQRYDRIAGRTERPGAVYGRNLYSAPGSLTTCLLRHWRPPVVLTTTTIRPLFDVVFQYCAAGRLSTANKVRVGCGPVIGTKKMDRPGFLSGISSHHGGCRCGGREAQSGRRRLSGTAGVQGRVPRWSRVGRGARSRAAICRLRSRDLPRCRTWWLRQDRRDGAQRPC